MIDKRFFNKIEFLDNEKEFTQWMDVVNYIEDYFVANNLATKEYFESICEDLTKYQAYMVIIPHCALLHSSAHKGVMKDAYHLLKLKKPINFGHPHNDPVKLIITFGAKNKEGHMKSIQEIAGLLMDEKKLKKLLNAQSTDELINGLY